VSAELSGSYHLVIHKIFLADAALISTKSWLITNAETTAIEEVGANAVIEVRS
jgi:hypothetical protein